MYVLDIGGDEYSSILITLPRVQWFKIFIDFLALEYTILRCIALTDQFVSTFLPNYGRHTLTSSCDVASFEIDRKPQSAVFGFFIQQA